MTEDEPGYRVDLNEILNTARMRHRRQPLRDECATNPQRNFEGKWARYVLWRAGNQIGKSHSLARLIVRFCRGELPWQKHRPPVEVLVVSYSWEQMDPLCEKIWNLLPKDEIAPEVRYQKGNGFRGFKIPVIPFVKGDGAGSVIRFATYQQGTKRIAGPSVHLAVLDEPPPEQVYGEIIPRLKHHKGYLRIGFTPTPNSPDLEYLRKRVKVWQEAGEPEGGCAGGIVEVQTTLTADACTPRGRLIEVPWMTEAEIEAYAADLLDRERAMRMEGSWDQIVTERLLSNWSDACERWCKPPDGAFVMVGVDHGTDLGKQAAILVAMTHHATLAPRVWVMDEVVNESATTPEMDAAAILNMLARNGLNYDNVDEWIGDRSTGWNKWAVRKSNKDLRVYLAAEIKRPYSRLKFIHTPKKFTGSEDYGLRIMNAIMGRVDEETERSHFLVSPRAKAFREACRTYRGDKRDPVKDVLDAGRYPIERHVKLGGWFKARAIYG